MNKRANKNNLVTYYMQLIKQHKKLLLLSFLLICVFSVFAQESLMPDRKETMQEAWHQKWLSDGNHHLKPFLGVFHTDSVTKKENFSVGIKHGKELLFYIPDHFQMMDKYGNQYIQAYLYNFTDTVVTLQCYDDALGFLDHYFMPDKEWVKAKPLVMGLCGNGIWTQQLPPRHYLYLRIENGNLIKGDKKIPYKLVLNINEQVQLEARTVAVHLFENQILKIQQGQ